MARYIDVEKVDVTEVSIYCNPEDVQEWLEEQPTADVVEVVRCKDCKHSFFIKSCSKYECQKGCGSLKYSNDYCSYGERKCDNG